MADRITARRFLGSPGVDDWRAVLGGTWVCARFRTGSYATGVALVAAIGEPAAGIGRPDVDLRPDSVDVRPVGDGPEGLTAGDVELARRISVAARGLGAAAEPAAVQHVQVAIDALVIADVRPFWRAVLGYQELGEEDVVDPARRGPTFWFQDMAAPRPQRNRVHVDVYLAPDQVRNRIAAAVAAGGRVVRSNAPDYWTLADPEANEVDLAVWVAE
ncbi:VOC family protein [Pseudonocardia humida]|uniref:4a-hydroxytetrahydrobiopterin dehydratase n=1 Tax=Pseudonocardia humida TaxID=2800819 RepID=A0ABT1AAD4_9PSEU|nr:VOC family protein [Pseudonocardia humida]MCO1659977.1 4a-hydroxytetrahydrobiopterin dehydratase [Pseudonocardia humida]